MANLYVLAGKVSQTAASRFGRMSITPSLMP